MGKPRVVALGGGHGLACVLRAVRRYTDEVLAIVSVADDGGSSGRLRRDLDVLPPGDLRRCLVALADDELWPAAFEHRFSAGELEGHPLGNLVLAGLDETLGDPVAAIDAAAALLRAVGRVRPATAEPVVLKADVDGESVEGQVAVMNVAGRIRRVELVPDDAPAHPDVLAAIAEADQVVLAPGSLYTSLLPVLCVAGIRDAVARTGAQVVQVCNLHPQPPETTGLDGSDHLRAVLDHGTHVDVFLIEADGALAVDATLVSEWGVRLVAGDVARPSGRAHDPVKLAPALADLLESN
ncbi:MAG TPA: uridine diphosphate-N-acetylglucosamine-binding protein YvcK [Acidimicrobiia bacterium]